jgi:hypothetical protein
LRNSIFERCTTRYGATVVDDSRSTREPVVKVVAILECVQPLFNQGEKDCGRKDTREVGVVVSGSQNEEEEDRGWQGSDTKSEFTMDLEKTWCNKFSYS